MAVKTYAEQLEEVQAAISAILTGGQSYSISTGQGARGLTRASLGELRELEAQLRVAVAREERGGIRVRRATPTP